MFTNVHHTLRIELIVLCMIFYHSVKRILVDNISCCLNVKTIVLMQFIKASGFLLAEILIIENYRLFDGVDVIHYTRTVAILLWLPLVEKFGPIIYISLSWNSNIFVNNFTFAIQNNRKNKITSLS